MLDYVRFGFSTISLWVQMVRHYGFLLVAWEDVKSWFFFFFCLCLINVRNSLDVRCVLFPPYKVLFLFNFQLSIWICHLCQCASDLYCMFQHVYFQLLNQRFLSHCGCVILSRSIQLVIEFGHLRRFIHVRHHSCFVLLFFINNYYCLF